MPAAVPLIFTLIRLLAVQIQVSVRLRDAVQIRLYHCQVLLDPPLHIQNLIRTVLQPEQFVQFQLSPPLIAAVNVHVVNLCHRYPAMGQHIVLIRHIVKIDLVDFRGTLYLYELDLRLRPSENIHAAEIIFVQKRGFRDHRFSRIHKSPGILTHLLLIRAEFHQNMSPEIIPCKLPYLRARPQYRLRGRGLCLFRHMDVHPKHLGALNAAAVF